MLTQDALTLKRSTRLAELVPGLKRSGAYHVGPCPFCGGRDRFNIRHTDDGDLWICRQCGDGKYHDAIDFLIQSSGRTFAELVGNGAPVFVPAPAPLPTLDTPPSEDWQIVALEAAYEAANYLRSGAPVACQALERLQATSGEKARGLTWSTLDHFAIGYNPRPRKLANGLTLQPGVTIPRMVDGELWTLQVRRPDALVTQDGRKYQALAGGVSRSLFNADEAIGARSVFVVEGEFDAMVLRQNTPAAVVTMGAASNVPGVTWLRYFAAAHDIVLVLDMDEAGHKALKAWQALLPRARAVDVPGGFKDITDAMLSHTVDLAAWAADVLRSRETR